MNEPSKMWPTIDNPSRLVTILCGFDTEARKQWLLETQAATAPLGDLLILSAEDVLGGMGRPKPAHEQHETCLKRFIEGVSRLDGARSIVVNNDNASVAEIAPYAALAQAYGWDVIVLYFPLKGPQNDHMARKERFMKRAFASLPARWRKQKWID